MDDPDNAIKTAAENGGDGFEQFMSVWDGKSSYSKYRNNDGKAINLFCKPGEFVHSWVAFYK